MSASRGLRRAGLAALSGWPVALAVTLPLAWSGAQIHIGLGLRDEGFLWYGAQRVVAGELPLRDFQAYDIARYYWSAAWMSVMGNTGIVAMRIGNAVLMSATVVIATVLMRARTRQPPWLLAVGIATFTLWMFPDFKVADAFAALALTLGLAQAIDEPRPRRWAAFGFCIGLAGTIGINHAFYGTLALVLAAAYLALVRRIVIDARALLGLVAGGLVGYLPVLVLFVVAPGFLDAFVDSIRQLFEIGSTNLAIPVFGDVAAFDGDVPGRTLHAITKATKAAFFVATPLFVAAAVWRSSRIRSRDAPRTAAPSGAFVAATITSVAYAHYAFSRADLVHAAVSVLPVLVVAWTWPPGRTETRRALGLVAILVASATALVPNQPGYPAWRDAPLVRVDVAGDALRVPPPVAREVELVHRLVALHAQGGRAFYAAPYQPAAYAIAQRRSPTWEIYAVFPATPERQVREVERLAAARPAFAALSTDRIDDRADLGLARTHPDLVAWVARCMRRVDDVHARAIDIDVYLPLPEAGQATCPPRP